MICGLTEDNTQRIRELWTRTKLDLLSQAQIKNTDMQLAPHKIN